MKITKADVGRKVRLRDGKVLSIVDYTDNMRFYVEGMVFSHDNEGSYISANGIMCGSDIIAFVDEPKRKRGRPCKVNADDYTAIPKEYLTPEPADNRQYIAIELIKNGHEAAGVWLLTGEGK